MTVGAGLIGLDKDQHKTRSHNLKNSDKAGVYEIVKPIQFKVGELVELDTSKLSKTELKFLEVLEKPEVKQEPEVKPEPKAKTLKLNKAK